MSANQRGLLIFAFMIFAAWFLCGFLPSFFAGQGYAFALPVIQMPGEVYYEDFTILGLVWTNTATGTIVADLLVILVALVAWQASKGWSKEVPGRFQSIVEGLVGFLYGQTKSMAGTGELAKKYLFPLVASIFFFLLMANWVELVPGVDSIGLMHCAKPDMAGYGRVGNRLYSDEGLFAGYPVENEHQFEVCELYLEGHAVPGAGMNVEELEAGIHDVEEQLHALEDDHSHEAHDLQLSLAAYEMRVEALHELEALEGHEVDEEALAEAQAKVEAGEELTAEEQEVIDLAAEWQLAETRQVYPGAMFALTDEQLEEGEIQPYSFIVTPFIRAAATDMNLTFGLAIISVVAIQAFGVAALGPGYFMKFVNINALGNAAKRPMGIMDFGVGLFEIISELGKMISLAFRLFGNIFAGQLLLFIIGFLIATGMPMAVYLLELAVGGIQAYVFAVLTLVFSAQAMVSHAHDEDDDH